MRSRRQSLVVIISTKAPTSTAVMSKNMRPLTPPRNRMPIAIVAMTRKAPMSGSASSSSPTKPTATTIGSTARRKLLLHVHLAHHVAGGIHRHRELGELGRLEVHHARARSSGVRR